VDGNGDGDLDAHSHAHAYAHCDRNGDAYTYSNGDSNGDAYPYAHTHAISHANVDPAAPGNVDPYAGLCATYADAGPRVARAVGSRDAGRERPSWRQHDIRRPAPAWPPHLEFSVSAQPP
jgi:hypothetical protein